MFGYTKKGVMESSLRVLINLARTDGKIQPAEEALIHKIGRAHGLSDQEIEEEMHLGNIPPDLQMTDIGDDDRFETLYNLVLLMKVDGQVFDEEITFCLTMAKKLGYPMEAVMDLYSLVHSNVKLTAEIQKIRKKYE